MVQTFLALSRCREGFAGPIGPKELSTFAMPSLPVLTSRKAPYCFCPARAFSTILSDDT